MRALLALRRALARGLDWMFDPLGAVPPGWEDPDKVVPDKHHCGDKTCTEAHP